MYSLKLVIIFLVHLVDVDDSVESMFLIELFINDVDSIS